jgi:sterol desaturase/sphingolipid hydroxylase (fatty acid hydroxylase superfamily)
MSELLDPATVATPLYLVSVLWEQRAARRAKARGEAIVGYERRDTWASLGMGLVSVLTVGVLNQGVQALADVLWKYRVTDLGTGVLGWAVAMLGWDFAYYWAHRWEHESRFLWAAHVNHHSSQHYNLSTALRQPWLPIIALVNFPPLALLGVRPWMILFAGGFNLVYQFWVHTELVQRCPAWFELVFNTPSHHRVHHGSNPEYIDRNHGGILIVWDRLFGTFAEERAKVVYGLTKNIETFSLWEIFSHEVVAIAKDVAKARTFSERLGYVFRGPGWAPGRGAPAE